MRINLFSKLSLVCLALFTSSCHDNTSTSPEPLLLSSSGQSWMSKLSSDLLLSAITIPGTHESCALYEPLYGTAKCQDLSISDQLKAGVRFLDIRCRHYYNSFAIHHGSIFQNQNFDDVLNACFSFLAADSNETIIMSVNEEYTPEGTTRSFEDTFFAYYSKNTKGWYVGESIPTLGAVRGKIVLFRRFSAQNHLPLGLPADDWQDNTTFSCSKVWIRVQDCYQVTDNNSKYSYITSFLSEAVAGPGYMMYLNFTSGYQLGLYGIPDIRVVSNFINDNVNGYFSACGVARYGIVILNFANSSLCTKIYSKN